MLEVVRKALGRALKNLTPLEAKSRTAFLPPFREARSEELPFLREPQAALTSPAAFPSPRPGQESWEALDRASEAAPDFFRPPVSGETGPFRDCSCWDKYTDRTFWPWGNRVCWWWISMPPTSGSCMKSFFRDSAGAGGASQFLLTPLELELSPTDPETVRDLETGLRTLGFDWAPGDDPRTGLRPSPRIYRPPRRRKPCGRFFRPNVRPGNNRPLRSDRKAAEDHGLPWGRQSRPIPDGSGDAKLAACIGSNRAPLALPPRAAPVVPAVAG